jgi:hypothetical protein
LIACSNASARFCDKSEGGIETAAIRKAAMIAAGRRRRITNYLNVAFWGFVRIGSHCNHPGAGRERDCAAAAMWKPTALMYDSI